MLIMLLILFLWLHGNCGCNSRGLLCCRQDVCLYHFNNIELGNLVLPFTSYRRLIMLLKTEQTQIRQLL